VPGFFFTDHLASSITRKKKSITALAFDPWISEHVYGVNDSVLLLRNPLVVCTFRKHVHQFDFFIPVWVWLDFAI
jgi:hypothetical protein